MTTHDWRRSKLERGFQKVALFMLGSPSLARYRRVNRLRQIDAEFHGQLHRMIRWVLPFYLARFGVYYLLLSIPDLATRLILDVYNGSHSNFSEQSAGFPWFSLLFVILVGQYVWTRRIAIPALAVGRLVTLIYFIDKAQWQHDDIRIWRRLNPGLERLARQYESMGRYLRPGDPNTAAKLDKWGRGVATSVRELKLLAFSPSRSQFLCMTDRLYEDVAILVSNRWEELPYVEPPPPPSGPSWFQRIPWVFVAIICAGGFIAAVTFSTRLGGAGQYILPLLGAGGLVALSRAGFSVKDLVTARESYSTLSGGN